MIRRIPWTTFAVVAAALLVAASPAVQEALIYDREKIFTGEVWRMFGGHFVHLSTRHLLLDVSAFAVLGAVIEAKRVPGFSALCLFGPWLISASTLALAPQMQRYCGLSALALAASVFIGVTLLRDRGRHRFIAIVILILAFSKIFYELFAQHALFVTVAFPVVRVATVSHLAGALVGALFAFIASKPNIARNPAVLGATSKAA